MRNTVYLPLHLPLWHMHAFLDLLALCISDEYASLSWQEAAPREIHMVLHAQSLGGLKPWLASVVFSSGMGLHMATTGIWILRIPCLAKESRRLAELLLANCESRHCDDVCSAAARWDTGL